MEEIAKIFDGKDAAVGHVKVDGGLNNVSSNVETTEISLADPGHEKQQTISSGDRRE